MYKGDKERDKKEEKKRGKKKEKRKIGTDILDETHLVL